MPLQTLTPELAAQIAVDYPALQSLNLSNNALYNVRHLQLLPRSLTQLDLGGNCLSTLPEELGEWLPALRFLRLRANAIESLCSLSRCRQLQTLDIGANNVTLASELRFLQPLTQLRHLSLDGNPLAKSPIYRCETLTILPQLQTLDDQEITAAERLHAKLQLKTLINNGVSSRKGPSPAPSPRLLTPESLQTHTNLKQEVTMPPVNLALSVNVNELKRTDELDQEETRWEAKQKYFHSRGKVKRQPSPSMVAPSVTPSLARQFDCLVQKRPEIFEQTTESNQHDCCSNGHENTISQCFGDNYKENIRRTDRSKCTAVLTVETKEELLKSRIEALEGILAVQDRTIRQTLVQFGKQSLVFQTNHLSTTGSDDVPTIEAAAAVYTRLLAAWREKCVALMVQARSDELANEALTHEFRQQEVQITENLGRCKEKLEMWQQRAADYKAQRDLEEVATRQADAGCVQANAKAVQAVRVVALERKKLQTIAETVVRFTGGLVRDKVEQLHRGSARLQALERRLVHVKERVELASTLLTHREARLRNSEAALEADRRVWARRLEQMRNTRLQGQESKSSNNGSTSNVSKMRPHLDGTLLRPATETALRALFHRLDCYDTGLVQSQALLQALRRGDPTVLSAVGGPKKLSKLVSHVEVAFGSRTRATLTWGEFLLFFIPESSMSPAAFSEDYEENGTKFEPETRLGNSNDACYLCTGIINNDIPSWPFASASSTTQHTVQTDMEKTGVKSRKERKALETLSHAELVHQIAVLRTDRQHLRRLLARDAHDLRDRVRLVRREWEAKTSEVVLRNEKLQRDLQEQAGDLLKTQKQQERAEVARDEALLEVQRFRELLLTQEQDFELQKKEQEALKAKRLQDEHDIWQTEIQDARLAHSLLQSDHSKQQTRIRQLERDLARQKEALLAHETERVASLEEKVRRRDSELARLRRERNTLLNSLREHELKLAMANAPKNVTPMESISTQTKQPPRLKQRTVASQTQAASIHIASGKRDRTNDGRMSVKEISLEAPIEDKGTTTYRPVNEPAPNLTPEDVNLRLQKLQTLTESLLADY